jgi:peptidoglycan hydrolase-like protein with peptidoglycan-binding domain
MMYLAAANPAELPIERRHQGMKTDNNSNSYGISNISAGRVNTISPPYPGTLLRNGSRGSNVEVMQRTLNIIADRFPSIPRVVPDGIFGPLTEAQVRAFQRLFALTDDGVIGPITWNAIIFVRGPEEFPVPPPYPGTLLRVGSRGENVRILQLYINRLGDTDNSVPRISADGIFGPLTEASVRAAQRVLGLTIDGIVGPITWNAVVR